MEVMSHCDSSPQDTEIAAVSMCAGTNLKSAASNLLNTHLNIRIRHKFAVVCLSTFLKLSEVIALLQFVFFVLLTTAVLVMH